MPIMQIVFDVFVIIYIYIFLNDTCICCMYVLVFDTSIHDVFESSFDTCLCSMYLIHLWFMFETLDRYR